MGGLFAFGRGVEAQEAAAGGSSRRQDRMQKQVLSPLEEVGEEKQTPVLVRM